MIEITPSDIPKLQRKIKSAARDATLNIERLCGTKKSLLYALRFLEVGHHPIDGHALNIVEQVNQTFTCLVSLRAAHHIFKRHKVKRLRLNLGNKSGTDVESLNLSIAAEVFAAVRPTNNRKLYYDIAKVLDTVAKHKYVFFYSPNVDVGRRRELEGNSGVEVHAVKIEI